VKVIKRPKDTSSDHIIDDSHDISRLSKPMSTLRTSKTSLNKILIGNNRNNNKRIIFDAVTRTHQIIVHLCMFLRLFILDKYHNNQPIPHINKNFMSMAIKALIATSVAGPTPKGSNLDMFNEFKKFYISDYKQLGYTEKIDGSNLSQILGYMETDIITNIENNIKLHFFKYVNQFVNSSFKSKHKQLVETVKKKDKQSLKKQLDKELYELKQDLLNNTLESDVKYHAWINQHRPHIFPINITDSYEFDISHNPQKYLKHMIYMCIEIEKIGGKSFQFFPIRSNIVPKYIPIDTTTLIDLFMSENKNEYYNDVDRYKNILWDKLLKTSDPVAPLKPGIFP
jgi:hypothetical protein